MRFELFIPFLEKTSLQLLNVIYGLLAIIVGLVIARALEKLAVWLANVLKIDDLLEAIKFTPLLQKGDVKLSASKLFGGIVYWVTVYFLIAAVAFFSGLPIEAALEKIFSYLAVVLLATVVLALGSFLGVVFGNLVYAIAVNMGFPGAKTISRLTQYAAVIMAFLLALEQLGIGPELLVTSIGVIIGAVGLAVAIAFGLGCKDMMADFVSNLIKGK